MKVFDNTTKNIFLTSWVSINHTEARDANVSQLHQPIKKPQADIFKPLRRWINSIQICNPEQAHRLCAAIPAQCPFERDVKLFGNTLFHIPPMCKLNPLYEELVSLRFRALCYLADECGEDVTQYC
jgi:hypothetical protein